MPVFHYIIEAHHDFEFNSVIRRKIDYSIYLPEGGWEGLVLFIAGFGADAGPYRENFQHHIGDEYSMACLTVDYHCFCSRPNSGGAISNDGAISIEPQVMAMLRSITGCVNNENIDDVLLKAGEMRINKQIPLRVPGLIVPGKNEYQNFGILPALDNIYALNDVFIRYPQIPKKIFAIGSSYGGYIANLISKLAPSTLNAVFDNSSWAVPNLNYVVGRDMGAAEFIMAHSQGVNLELNVLSPWSQYTFMPNGFDQSKYMMRSFPENHIETMSRAANCKTVYRFTHAEKDFIADTQQKMAMTDSLKKRGFNVEMNIYSAKDIDGSYIKSMDHGMGLSMRKFFAQCLQKSQDAIRDDRIIDFDFEHRLNFECEDQTYTVRYSGNEQPQCSLS